MIVPLSIPRSAVESLTFCFIATVSNHQAGDASSTSGSVSLKGPRHPGTRASTKRQRPRAEGVRGWREKPQAGSQVSEHCVMTRRPKYFRRDVFGALFFFILPSLADLPNPVCGAPRPLQGYDVQADQHDQQHCVQITLFVRLEHLEYRVRTVSRAGLGA